MNAVTIPKIYAITSAMGNPEDIVEQQNPEFLNMSLMAWDQQNIIERLVLLESV